MQTTTTTHALANLRPDGTAYVWTCSCGDTGRSTRAFEGEDVARKARGNQRAHARRRRDAGK